MSPHGPPWRLLLLAIVLAALLGALLALIQGPATHPAHRTPPARLR